MKKIVIAGAATLIALGGLNASPAMAQGTSPGSDTGPATTTTPGVTGQPSPTPGAVPPAGPGDTAAGTTPDTASAGRTVEAAKPSGPEKGANSFTESQAQARLSDAGYTSVTGLKKDGDGIWHGSAMKNGQQVSVWLDYAGNVGQS